MPYSRDDRFVTAFYLPVRLGLLRGLCQRLQSEEPEESFGKLTHELKLTIRQEVIWYTV